MRIHLPNSAFLGNLDPFLRSFDPEEPDRLEITANKKWIAVHPVVLSMTAALGLSTNGGLKISCEALEAKSKHYLERMGLFKLLNVESGISIKEHESAGRFIPLTKIKTSEELTKFIAEMVPLLHATPSQAKSIKYVISELVRNVFEHSQSLVGAIVCAQYYPKSNAIKIGVADCGVGIKKTINRSHKAQNHLDAIKLALTPGITGTTNKFGGTALNAGAGLFFIKSIAKVNREFFIIYSGDSMYKLLKTPLSVKRIRLNADPFADKCSKESDFPLWQGTVVGIDISLDQNQDFVYLLDLIREVYQKKIKERKKQQYKRARFI